MDESEHLHDMSGFIVQNGFPVCQKIVYVGITVHQALLLVAVDLE